MKVTGIDVFLTIGTDNYRAMIRPDGTNKGGVLKNPGTKDQWICLFNADRCHIIDFLTEKGADRLVIDSLFPRMVS